MVLIGLILILIILVIFKTHVSYYYNLSEDYFVIKKHVKVFKIGYSTTYLKTIKYKKFNDCRYKLLKDGYKVYYKET